MRIQGIWDSRAFIYLFFIRDVANEDISLEVNILERKKKEIKKINIVNNNIIGWTQNKICLYFFKPD